MKYCEGPKEVKDMFTARADGTGLESLPPWKWRAEKQKLRPAFLQPGQLSKIISQKLWKKKGNKRTGPYVALWWRIHEVMCKALSVEGILGSEKDIVGGRERGRGWGRRGWQGGKEERRWREGRKRNRQNSKTALWRTAIVWRVKAEDAHQQTNGYQQGRKEAQCSKHSGVQGNRLWQWISCGWGGKSRKSARLLTCTNE